MSLRTWSAFFKSSVVLIILFSGSLAEATGIANRQWLSGFANGFAVGSLPVPGGIAVVDLGPERLPAPSVHWGERRVLVQKNAGRWLALVGIPLGTKTGKYRLSVFSTTQRYSAFTVSSRHYPKQELIITDASKVTPPANALPRIRNEGRRMATARRGWRDQFDASVFTLPLEGRHSAQFGLRRIYNGKPGNRHTGLDIAAAEGTPIYSPADGLVTEVGDFYFNGLSVFVDHGHGLVTLYSHLSHTDLKTGDVVRQGQPLGHVGASGRVTGPHLHWSVGLNGTWVDPLLFLPGQAQ